ncbi:4a-hydroxytetrahydrobiopterin dehydratase [Nitrososphaera viennensis]|nr:4a-hydroxytetrahydrobiopterin dehydratase [Nitrososphaera viennensis]UVS68767.1 4a-hydroxytetrahydrobiopterin dehydratase [Nitrososphaera viennensis]
MTRIFSSKQDDDNNNDGGRSRPAGKQEMLRLALAIAAASMLAIFAYTGITLSQGQQQQDAEARTLLGRVLVTKTMASGQDPAPGHEAHQSAVFLPPLGDDVIYSGTLTWAASGPVELFTYHHYDGPAKNAPPLYTEPSNNKTYASPLFFAMPDSADHGSMSLAANAVGFHSLEGRPFTVTATFDGWTKRVALEKFSPGGNATGYLTAAAANNKTKSPATLIPETAVNPADMAYIILPESRIKELANSTELSGWQVVDDGGRSKLHKTFQFKNFVQAFQFMYNVGLETEKMNHHPDWTNNYNTVSVYLYSWSVGNKITDYDVKLAGVMNREAEALGATTIATAESSGSAGKVVFDSPHVRVDYLFSTERGDGTTIGQELLEQTRTELAERFGGVTVLPPFSGTTIQNGTRHDGASNAGFFVVAPNTPENIEWFLDYREAIEERFGIDGIFTTISPSMIA